MKILLLLILTFSCAHQAQRKAPSDRLSILQLMTNETSVEFNLLLPKGHGYTFSVLTPEGEKFPVQQSQVSEFENSDWVIQNIAFTGLKYSPEIFKLQIHGSLQLKEVRDFKLFSQTGEKFHFAVGSCADDRHDDQAIYQQIESRKPEWIFLIGDNHYATQKGELSSSDLWESLVRARQQLALYHLPQLIPTHATWDDNDYGMNNGDKSFVHREASQHLFKVFFHPQLLLQHMNLGPGIATRLMLRGMHFSFLDNRSFRDAPSPEGEHFGREQEDWFFEDLKREALPTWIISGDQFFGGYHEFESFEGLHPQRFDQFITRLKDVQTPFVFISGDRHLSEIMQFPRAVLGQLSFEFTSSPLHAKTYPGSIEAKANPWRVVGVDGVNNMLFFHTQLEEQSWRIKPQAVSSSGAVLFERELSLTTERLKDFEADKPKRRRYRRARWRRR